MSRFFSERLGRLVPYTPGEQPRDARYVKLNTNESPFPPSPKAVEEAKKEARNLRLYSDPTCKRLIDEATKVFPVKENEIVFGNGSDELLFFAFSAFCGEKRPAVFPDITYGFYPVFAEMAGVPYREIPLRDDFSLSLSDYAGGEKVFFLANPNAPTGMAIPKKEIESFLAENPGVLVVLDEAYVDFGAESCLELIEKFDNLLVIQTFSKSRSMAGARLGFAAGNASLIADMNTVRYSFNPYNINRMTMAAGIGALRDEDTRRANCSIIAENRETTAKELGNLGFSLTDSLSNFLFASHPRLDGEKYYLALKEKGILVRHFSKKRIGDRVRITVGTADQMRALLKATEEILKETAQRKESQK